jgi:signal transduction histidine kinase
VRIRQDSIRHVVVNLLDNAVKYGPQSQTITVEVETRDGDALIAVSDQGQGVPETEREAVWRPFARAKTPTDAAGSGIGLTIVRDVMSQNGGRAWVESAPGGGARFIVSMPSAGTSPEFDPRSIEGTKLESASVD